MWDTIIMSNIEKSIASNNISNGSTTVNTGGLFQKLDTSKDTDPLLINIQNLNKIKQYLKF